MTELELDTSSIENEESDVFIPMQLGFGDTSAYTNPYPHKVAAVEFQNHVQPQYHFPTEVPLSQFVKSKKEEAPGFFENFGHVFAKVNPEIQAGKYAYNQFSPNHLLDDTPFGWKVNAEDLEGYDEKYWDLLLSSPGPNALEQNKQLINEEVYNDEYFANGGWPSSLIGGTAGSILSLSNYSLFRLLTIPKYASYTATAVYGTARALPVMGVESTLRNGLNQLNRQVASRDDFIYDSITDTVMGSVLIGAGAAIGKATHELKLWDTREAYKMYIQNGIKLDPIYNEKGILTGDINVSKVDGGSLSAAEIDYAKSWYNERFEYSGFFAIPYVGDKLRKGVQLATLGSPATKAAFSRFPAVQKFYNGIAGSPFYRQGIDATQTPAEIIAQRYSKKALDLQVFADEQFKSANGLNGNTVAGKLKNLAQTATNNKNITRENFNSEVLEILSDGNYKSEYSQAHALADRVHENLNEMNELYAKHTGRPLFDDPRNAYRYFPLINNLSTMSGRREDYWKLASKLIKQQDELIDKINLPIQNAKSQIKKLQSQIKKIKADDPNLINFKDELKAAKNQLKKLERNYHEELIGNKDYEMMLKERNPLTMDERKELNTLLEKVKKAKTPEEKAAAELELQNKADAGEINRKFYKQVGIGGKVEFLNPNETPKLRASHGSGLAGDEARMKSAKSIWESKMQMTDEDIMSSVFGQQNPSLGMPNYFKRRTVMLPVAEFVKHGFQDTDIVSAMKNYYKIVGRDLAFKEAFPEYAQALDFDGLLYGLKQDYDKQSNIISKTLEGKKKEKAFNELQRDFEHAQKFMNQTYQAYFGTFSKDYDPRLVGAISGLKNLTSAALMGGIVTYQIAEIGAIMVKNKIFNTVTNGLRPLVKSLFEQVKLLKSEELELFRNNAAQVGLGLNTVSRSLGTKLYNPEMLKLPPGNPWMKTFVAGTEKLTHFTMNLFGSNLLADVNERVAASAFQARVMQAMFDYSAGKITNKELKLMAHYGFDMEKDSATFIKNMKEAGGYKKGRVIQSKYWQWKDEDAIIKMGDGIRRGVKDSVINTDKYSSPYWHRDPVLSLFSMYHGWAYNAFNRLTVPLLQRPDAEQILTTTIMVGLNALSEPLKRLSHGKDFFKDDESWWKATNTALEYAGLYGGSYDQLANLNKLMGDPFWESTEKRSGYTPESALWGPALNNVWTALKFSGHTIKGDVTEGDVKKFARLFPGKSQVVWSNQVDKWIESFGLPQKRSREE